MKQPGKVKLGEILIESKIESHNPNINNRIKVRLNMKGVEKRPPHNDKPGATKYYTRKAGQFIYGKQNLFKGAFGIVPEELDGFESSSDIPAFDLTEDCMPEWLYYFLKQGNYYKKLEKIASGTGSKRVQPKRFYNTEIPLPSIVKQKELCEKFAKYEKSIQKLLSEVSYSQNLIAELRKSILQEAVQGKLVPQDPNNEPASELLKRIKTEKEQLLANKRIRKEKTLPEINDTEIPYELKKGWEWCRVADIVLFTDAGKSPDCEKRPAKDDEWGVLTTTAIQKNHFNENANKVLPPNYEINNKHKVKKNDILITRAGPLKRTGICCRVSSLTKDLVLSDKTIRLNIISEFIYPDYIVYMLNSSLIRDILRKKMSGMAKSQVNISQKNIKLTTIPLPPKIEQKRIVAKVNELMSLCDELETQIQKSKENADMLMQSVLQEAFAA